MKNNRKRLNNKGFTLIELLAVVVILAVVMGIAMTSVLSSMNNSRKGSLQNSAESTAQIFQNKYGEAMISGGTGNIFGTKAADGTWSGGYNFATSGTNIYTLSSTVASDLNLSGKAYALDTAINNVTITSNAATTDKSFIAFDGERIVACLVAENNGSYYVGKAASTSSYGKTVDVLGVTVTIGEGKMYACSNEKQSWQ